MGHKFISALHYFVLPSLNKVFIIIIMQRLLNLLRAPREVDWEWHLSAKRQMVLWCFAYDDLNYSRYLSADLSNVSHPEEDHQKLGNTLRLEDSPSS